MKHVPSQGSVAEEGRAIQLLCDTLTAAGQPASIVGRPDQDPTDPLTVDAVIDVDGRRWAVDVCAVTFSPKLLPAMQRGDAALRGPLEAIAAREGCGLRVAYVPQEGEPGEADWGADYYKRIIEAAEGLAQQGAGASELVADGTDIEVLMEPEAGAPRVQLLKWLAKTPDIAQSVTDELTRPVTKKLTGQLARAKSAGYPVALLLDLVAPVDTKLWRQFMAGPESVREAVQPLLGQYPGVVDQVWLRDPDLHLHRLL